ncbi:MAG: LysR family transcriptional regulator [Gammaproteobacteria bacterium]|nr:LysR family transcriptional regulator [Gammaproteobacteria bacterium]
MDIGLLKTFLEVHRTRHFGHAADNLYLTQSAVSARIRLLEQSVGVPLFTRARNNIELTPAGQKLLKYAETIVNTWNRARQDISLDQTGQVPLVVGGVPSLWDIFLQDWLNDLTRKNTNLSIHAEVHGHDTLIRLLLNGALDIAFIFEPLQMAELLVKEIMNIHLMLISTKPNQTAQDAVNDKYILVNWGTSFAIHHAQNFPDMTPPKIHVHLGRLAYSHIRECGGSAYLAESMVQDDIKNRRLFVVQDAPVIKRMCYAAYTAHSDRLQDIEKAIRPLFEQVQ